MTARSKRLLALALIALAGSLALSLSGSRPETPLLGKEASPHAPSAAASGAPSSTSVAASAATSAAEASRSGLENSASSAPARRGGSIQRGQVVVKAPWGSGKGELGRSRPAEGAPEGPSAFAVDASGRVHVLDQVNSRIQIFKKGEDPVAVALPTDTFEDISVDSRGNTFVLDRGATGTIAMIDENGKIARSIPITGQGVSEAAGVTGVFARDDGVWVEVEHATLVRIADASGEPDVGRPIVQGRFSPDGSSLLMAALAGPNNALVSSKPASGGVGARFSTMLTFSLRVLGLHALEADLAGRIYLAVGQIRESETEPYDVVEERETVVIVGPSGAEVGRVEIAPLEGPETPLRPIRVTPDGIIYQLVMRENATFIERYVP